MIEKAKGLPADQVFPDRPNLKVRDVEAFRKVQALVLGPADLMASLNMRTLTVGEQPEGYDVGHAYHHVLGYDGKWVLHPDQIAAGNEIFAPAQQEYDHAELVLEAYRWHTSEAGGARGAAMLGDEMIDEASRKMALVVAAKGRAAGMTRQSPGFVPPVQ